MKSIYKNLKFKKIINYIKLYKSKRIYFFISLPRSGQTAVTNFLYKYFEQINLKFEYCEHYQCCKSYPCKDGKIISKGHDFFDEVPIMENHKYLILMRRDTLDQLDSYFW